MSTSAFATALSLLYRDPAHALADKLAALPRRFLPQSPRGLVAEGLPEAAGRYLDALVKETGCPRQFASLLGIRALFAYTQTLYWDADKLDAYLDQYCAAWPAERWEAGVYRAVAAAYEAREPVRLDAPVRAAAPTQCFGAAAHA